MIDDEDVVEEIVLDFAPVPQPDPPIVDKGDCGACVLAGLTGIELEDVYDYLSDGASAFTRTVMKRTLTKMKGDGLIDRSVSDVPVWLPRKPQQALNWGLPADAMAIRWWRHLRMALEAGCVGIAPTRVAGDGRVSDDGKYRMTDHFAMLSGVRELRSREENDVDSIYDRREVLVRCSSWRTPDETWIKCDRFLRHHGGYAPIYARPSRG